MISVSTLCLKSSLYAEEDLTQCVIKCTIFNTNTICNETDVICNILDVKCKKKANVIYNKLSTRIVIKN